MKTAIITGASSGLGIAFVRRIAGVFPEIESYWLIARRADRLAELAAQLPNAVCLPLDLCDPASFAVLQEKLETQRPEVRLVINNAGCGFLGNLGEMDTELETRMIDLNLRALTAITNLTIPYLGRGGHMINVSSIASFCPNPRLTVYSATKAYVSAFTCGLAEELRGKGITVTAVCPGPMETEFCDVGGITGQSPMFETLPYCDPQRVAQGTLRAARAGRTFYTPTAFYKFYRFVAKIVPMKLMVKFTKT